MSEWHYIDNIDIEDIDLNSREINIYAFSNYHGSVYVVLSFDQIEKIRELIKTAENQTA